MEMCYDGALVMPSNYAVMDENEMTYVEGGGSVVVTSTAKDIRNRLTSLIGLSVAGNADAAYIGYLLGGGLGAILAGIAANIWFKSYLSCATSAHNVVEGIIRDYGESRNCTMTTTYSFLYLCTGIDVALA